jgi:hypothetical protein
VPTPRPPNLLRLISTSGTGPSLGCGGPGPAASPCPRARGRPSPGRGGCRPVGTILDTARARCAPSTSNGSGPPSSTSPLGETTALCVSYAPSGARGCIARRSLGCFPARAHGNLPRVRRVGRPGSWSRGRGRRCLLEDCGFNLEGVDGFNFQLLPSPMDRLLPSLTARRADRVERQARGRWRRWLAAGFMVRARRH